MQPKINKALPVCKQCSKRATCPVQLMPIHVLIRICDLVKDAAFHQPINQPIVSLKIVHNLSTFLNKHMQ